MDLPRSAALARLASASLVTMYIALVPWCASAQTTGALSVYGRVAHQTGQQNRYQSGDHVLLYDFAKKSWVGPALTDNDGRFAFYDLPAAPYILALYVKGTPVWQNQISYRGVPLNFAINVPDR